MSLAAAASAPPPVVDSDRRPRRRRRSRKPAAKDDSELLAQQLAEEEAQQLQREEEDSLRLAQAMLMQEEAEEEENELHSQLVRMLQLQSDEELALEIQTQSDDVRFAKELQRELGPQSYSARVAAAASSSSSSRGGAAFLKRDVDDDDLDDDSLLPARYTGDDLLQAVRVFNTSSSCSPSSSSSSSHATRARLRELQAKDARYNLAYQPDIQRTKAQLRKELRAEADFDFLARNRNVVRVLLPLLLVHDQPSASSSCSDTPPPPPPPVLEVDLHLMTVAQSQERVQALLELLVRRRVSGAVNRVVLITGKGSVGPSRLGPAMLSLCEHRRDLVRVCVRGEGKVDLGLVRLL